MTKRKYAKRRTVHQRKKPGAETTLRKCIMCRKDFPSESVGDRFCEDCRKTSAYKEGYDPYTIWR